MCVSLDITQLQVSYQPLLAHAAVLQAGQYAHTWHYRPQLPVDFMSPVTSMTRGPLKLQDLHGLNATQNNISSYTSICKHLLISVLLILGLIVPRILFSLLSQAFPQSWSRSYALRGRELKPTVIHSSSLSTLS